MKDIQERIDELSKEFYAQMIDFAQRIIRTPSLSGEEKNVAGIIMEELKTLDYDEVFTDKVGNVTGVVRGTEEGPDIMYNGHMDHVDIGDVSEWEGYDPYGCVIDTVNMFNEDGTEGPAKVIHGRAAADTKGGIACQVYSGAVLAILKKEGYPIKGNFIFSGVVLEEPAEQIGMIEEFEHTLPDHGYHVKGVVSCEATSLKLYLGHRGRVELKIVVEGRISHASAPWLGINAVYKAMKLIEKIHERYDCSPVLEDPKLGKSTAAVTIISCTPGAMSVVPDRCIVTLDRRIVPGETPQSAVDDIQEMIDELSVEDPEFKATVSINIVPRHTYTGLTVSIPNIKEGYRLEENHPFIKACADALRKIGEPVSYGYWDFGTDLAMVSGRHHVASVGYSPMQEFYCHRPVDKVRIDFMERALRGNVAIFRGLSELTNDSDFKC